MAIQGINKAYEYQVGSSGYGSVLQRETLHATCGSETRSGASRQGGYNSSASEELIIFDHLMPKSPQLEGMHDWYVTDLSFDAFKLENGKWSFINNIKPRSTNNFKDRPYNDPQ